MKTLKAIHRKPKRFQIGWSRECFVYGKDNLTVCNHSGSCRTCPKYKDAMRRKVEK